MGDRKVMHLVDKAWRNIPTKFQIDPTGNHGFMPLGLKVNAYPKNNSHETFRNGRKRSNVLTVYKTNEPKCLRNHVHDAIQKRKKNCNGLR